MRWGMILYDDITLSKLTILCNNYEEGEEKGCKTWDKDRSQEGWKLSLRAWAFQRVLSFCAILTADRHRQGHSRRNQVQTKRTYLKPNRHRQNYMPAHWLSFVAYRLGLQKEDLLLDKDSLTNQSSDQLVQEDSVWLQPKCHCLKRTALSQLQHCTTQGKTAGKGLLGALSAKTMHLQGTFI